MQKITCETSAEETSVDYEKVATWIISRGEGVCTKLEIPQRLFHRDGSQGQFANFLQAILPHIGKSLSSLSVAAKCACSDIESIVQFAKGLTSLELSCLDANLDKRKLRHLSGLRELSELVIRVDDTGSIYYNHSYSRSKECPILGSVTGLPKLREISISYSEHSGDESYLFPRTIGHLSKLEKLSLESPLVVKLPEEFTLLKNLKELSFTWSRCTNFLNSKETWKFFGRLPNLASLSLHRCYFERISVIEKQRLGRLKRLVLNDTHFSWMGPEGFPEGFFPHLVDLEELVLSSSDLSALPNDIFCLKKLEVLDISDNSIVDMPTWEMYSLPMLESLKTLKAGGNPFPALPRKFLLGCPNLEYLWIEHCENLEISASMSWLFNSNTQLKLVDIHKRSHRFQESSKRWLNELQAKVSETTRKLNYGDLTEYENVQGKKVCSCAIKD